MHAILRVWVEMRKRSPIIADELVLHGLNGPRVETRCARDFSRPSLGPTLPSVQWVAGHTQGEKRPGRSIYYPSTHI